MIDIGEMIDLDRYLGNDRPLGGHGIKGHDGQQVWKSTGRVGR